MQERLALAGCIVLGIVAIVMAAVFPGITRSPQDALRHLTKQMGGFSAVHRTLCGCLTAIDKIAPIITAISNEWQLYMTVFAGVFGFAVYTLMELWR